MEQLNIAVCEDDRADLQHLCRLITANGASANVSAFETGEDFLAACQPDRFDLIFMDPPYRKGLEKELILRLIHSRLVDEMTTIVVEAALDTEFSWLEDTIFTITREKTYKTNKHVFLERDSE